MRSQQSHLRTRDGVELVVRSYSPDAGDADRALVLVHGMSEHSQRYEHVARVAVECGWNVIVPDLRGHGHSGGTETHVNDFAEYVADLQQIVESLGLRPERTAFVGHSMGGLISARFAQTFQEKMAALVLLSPLLRLEVSVPPLLMAFGKVVSYARPTMRFHRPIDPTFTTRNPEALQRRLQDPLLHQSLTAAWFFAMRSALRAVWRQARQLTVPLLLLQAGTDRIVDAAAAQPWIEQVGSSDKSLRVFPEHYHELLNEHDWPQTWAGILDWLETRVPRSVADPSEAALKSA
jgi:alpha-beta hydrolase superfamily lysophospholipase